MPSVMETLTFTVTGANPQTYTTSAQINVDSNGVGSGTATFLYIGNNAGNDTVVATLTSQNGGEGSPFTSNQAGVAFQAVSGPIAVGPTASRKVFSLPSRPLQPGLVIGGGNAGPASRRGARTPQPEGGAWAQLTRKRSPRRG